MMRKMRKILLALLTALTLSVGGVALTSCDILGSGMSSEKSESSSTSSGSSEVSYSSSSSLSESLSTEESSESAESSSEVETSSVIEESSSENEDSSSDVGVKEPSEGLVYELLDDDTYAVVAIGKCEDTDVVIPSTYEGKAVTSIGDSAFSWCTSLTSVEIPSSVTSIGVDIFHFCLKLKNIEVSEDNVNYCDIDGNLYNKDRTTLIQYATAKTAIEFIVPDSVTSIGYRAFLNSESLTSVVIGEGVTSIGDRAFTDAYNLKNINVSENNANYCDIDGNLYNKDKTILIQYARGKTATEFIIPDSVTSIGERAFRTCGNLTRVVIPNSVTSIGEYAFEFCSSLTDVVIGQKH